MPHIRTSETTAARFKRAVVARHGYLRNALGREADAALAAWAAKLEAEAEVIA